jgi:hypothetical protein
MSDAGTALLTADSPGLTGFGGPQWGIFDQYGNAILEADSVASLGYTRDYQISDYYQEQGAFESYNKVQVPYQAKVGFYISATRTDFLNNVEAAVSSLQLVSVVMPEKSYPSANMMHYDFRREQRQGVTLILVTVWVEEVRIVAGGTAVTSGTVSPPNPTDVSQTSGTTSPIGQTNLAQGYAVPDANTGNGKTVTGGQNSVALSTGSTNGASAVNSGQVQPGGIPSNVTGMFALPN